MSSLSRFFVFRALNYWKVQLMVSFLCYDKNHSIEFKNQERVQGLYLIATTMHKYQVIFQFELDEELLSKVPQHRNFIGELIQKGIIDSYAISAESTQGWIVMNANSKKEVLQTLEKSPIYHKWVVEVEQLVIYDSQLYRFPKLVMN